MRRGGRCRSRRCSCSMIFFCRRILLVYSLDSALQSKLFSLLPCICSFVFLGHDRSNGGGQGTKPWTQTEITFTYTSDCLQNKSAEKVHICTLLSTLKNPITSPHAIAWLPLSTRHRHGIRQQLAKVPKDHTRPDKCQSCML